MFSPLREEFLTTLGPLKVAEDQRGKMRMRILQ